MLENKDIAEIVKIFLAMEKEHFKENELWICKGRRLQMTNIVNHMKICLMSIEKDRERGLDDKTVLETTVGAIKSLIDVCEEELRTNPNLLSNEI